MRNKVKLTVNHVTLYLYWTTHVSQETNLSFHIHEFVKFVTDSLVTMC